MKIAALHRCNFSSEGTSEISQLRSGWKVGQRFFQVLQGRRTFSIVPSGRNFLRTVFQPLRGWLISGCRFATPFALAAMILFFAIGATAQTTNTLSDAEIQGRQLAQILLEQRPTESFTNSGVLKIRDGKGKTIEIPTIFEASVTGTNWQSSYSIHKINTNENHAAWTALFVTHSDNAPNRYQFIKIFLEAEEFAPTNTNLSSEQTMISFAGSDFWVADLGLEFLHWPEQKIMKKEFSRGRGCVVLESTNPNPSTTGYSRVVSWIDEESYGIVHAEAYDAQNKLLKVFDPKSFKKVNGQWELQDMEIRNVQTGSRTRIEFDLKAK
jgi:hypothetical protein